MFDLSQADTNVWPAIDVDSAALLKRACGHEIGSQDHFGSLRRHYPHQVLRVPRKNSRISANGSPAGNKLFPEITATQGDSFGHALWLRFSFLPGRCRTSRRA